MVGLGETDEEVVEVLRDLRVHRVDIVTIGQYLSPGPKHLAVDRFVTPEQFDTYRRIGEEELGFLQVVSTPLTRSSYHAGEVQRLMAPSPLTGSIPARSSSPGPPGSSGPAAPTPGLQ